MKNNLKDKAKRLRHKGYSFREISNILDISKSTASVWTRNAELDIEARKRIKKLGLVGRNKAQSTIKKKQKEELLRISKECTVLKGREYNKDDYKLFLSLLYWGEGAKSRNSFNFINSDPEMIKVFLFLLRSSFNINEKKFSICVHLHEYHDKEEMISFWSKTTGVGKSQFYVYNKPHTGINKKKGYKGCLSVYYGDARIFKEVFVIVKRLVKYCGIS